MLKILFRFLQNSSVRSCFKGSLNMVMYHVLTIQKSEGKNSLIQFHVFTCNKDGYRSFKMVKRNTCLRKKEKNYYKD